MQGFVWKQKKLPTLPWCFPINPGMVSFGNEPSRQGWQFFSFPNETLPGLVEKYFSLKTKFQFKGKLSTKFNCQLCSKVTSCTALCQSLNISFQVHSSNFHRRLRRTSISIETMPWKAWAGLKKIYEFSWALFWKCFRLIGFMNALGLKKNGRDELCHIKWSIIVFINYDSPCNEFSLKCRANERWTFILWSAT